jgi:NADH-quinone oxidoreductase subunit I
LLGEGIIKGLMETARNFAGSYVSKERLTTVQYPEERCAPAEAARVFPFLVYDGPEWLAGLRCVACQICEKECPPKCIYIDKSTDKKPDAVGKPQNYPTRFDIDVSVCMSCQICVEVCPFEAIKMDTEFELATDDRFGGLLHDRQQLAKPNEYYHQIHPTEAAAVDGRLAAERAAAEAKAKAAAEAAAAKATPPAGTPPATPAAAAPIAAPAAAGAPKAGGER